jgi:hypothetical protein
MRPTTIRLACAVVAAVVALTVAELTSERFREFMSDHSLISTFIAEVILLAGVYLVIDELIERREARRWGDVTSLGLPRTVRGRTQARRDRPPHGRRAGC